MIAQKLDFKKTKAGMDALMQFFEVLIKEFFDFTFAEFQLEIAREIIMRVLLRKRFTISISICRQVGKTETVCFAVWFLCYIFSSIENEPFRVIITAPDEKTSTEFFDRLKLLFDQCENKMPQLFRFKEKTRGKITLPDGTNIKVYGLFRAFARKEDKKSTKEGRTAHLVIRDEKHLGDDSMFSDDVEPAMATTGGVDVWIGNGGFRQCEAKKIAEKGTCDNTKVFQYDYNDMLQIMQQSFNLTGNKLFLRWQDSQAQYVDKYGIDSAEVQKNLFNKWLVEVGNFTTPEKLYACRRQKEPEFWQTNLCDVGLDFAKSADKTVLTLTDYNCNIRDWEIFRGEYTEQVDEIVEFIKNAEKIVIIKNLFCDSTGVGDPVVAMLRKRLRQSVRGIHFNLRNKDTLGKKGLAAISETKDEDQRLSYPKNHKHTATFEHEIINLETEYSPQGFLKYHHPNANSAHDDFADSGFLSLWGIKKINQTRVFEKKAKGF